MKKTAFILSVILAFLIIPFLPACADGKTVSEYNIECEYADGKLVGSETVTFFNSSETTVSELKFNLFGNAFRKGAKYAPIAAQYHNKCYPDGDSFGDVAINSVAIESEKTDFKIAGEDKNVLCVPLKNEVFPNERVTVDIDFTLTLANVIARTGITDKTVNLANFYPILCALDSDGFYECVYYSDGDPFYSDCADYRVKLTCSENYVVAAAGKAVGSHSSSGKRTTEYTLKNARSFCMVLSDKFESVSDKSLGIDVTYYYYDDQTPQKSIETAVKSLKTFSDKYGDYAYDEFSVVQTPFNQGGMEFPTLVFIGDDVTGDAYYEVIVHETAHQWWQSAVGNNEIKYGFLDEGLAEYSVVVFYENNPEYNLSREAMIKSAEQTYKVFCTVYDKLFGKVNTTMLRSLNEYSGEYEYVNIAYIKSCIMYEELRKSIGDDTFFKSLKKYYSDFKFKNATPDDLVGAFEKCGADSNGFFESFFNGKVIL